jgi:hypothetical protein
MPKKSIDVRSAVLVTYREYVNSTSWKRSFDVTVGAFR